MTMKENQNENFNSICFGKDTDPLTFGSKDGYELNDSRINDSMGNEKGTMGSPKKAGQDGLPHLSMDNENGTVGSPRKESKGLMHQLSNWDKDTDSLSSDSYDMDKEQRSSEHENFGTVEEFEDCIQSDSRDTSSPFFTVKNMLECDLPELDVCYKEIDCQILKDICVDEGKHQKDVNVIESCTNEKPGRLSPQPPDVIDHFESEEDSSLDSNSSASDQCGTKEENENHSKALDSKEKLDSWPENSLEMVTADHCEPENAAETVEAYFDVTGKAETDSLDEDSLVDRKLPIEDLSARSSLVTNGGNKVMQVTDQRVLHEETVPESPAASSPEAGGTGNGVQANCLLYNSKGENRNITFNFDSGEGVAVGSGISEDVEEHSSGTGHVHKNVNADNLLDDSEAEVQCTSDRVGDSHQQSLISNEGVDEQSADLGDVHKDVNAENLPHARDEKVQCTSNSVDDYDERSPISNKGNSDGGSATSFDQCVRSEVSICENACEGSTDHTHTVLSHSQHDMGETSFSAASMITYSGPVAFSGSLSHRSDGSTTSGKSFAFPILQSEWNSSPVRMAKADRRHFRKHKGWRSGLLCCRF